MSFPIGPVPSLIYKSLLNRNIKKMLRKRTIGSPMHAPKNILTTLQPTGSSFARN